MNDQLIIALIIRPFLSFLKETIKNKRRKKQFDRYFIEARDLLLEWYPVEEPIGTRKATRK